jgi:hypothetical protein
MILASRILAKHQPCVVAKIRRVALHVVFDLTSDALGACQEYLIAFEALITILPVELIARLFGLMTG